MRRRASFLILLPILNVILFVGCRSHRKPSPQAVPPAPAAQPSTPPPPPATQIEPPHQEFPATPPAPEEVLSSDIAEANRTVQARGWIRDAFFAFDQSTLDDAAQQALADSARWLRAHPQYDLLVEGHCDERGTEQYNLALGDRRAEIAVSFLVTSGLDRSRIRTVSYGEDRPFAEGASEASWSQNRRAHLVLVKPR